MSKKNKFARMQKSQRNADEKVLRALSGAPEHPVPGLRWVLRHGNTLSVEKVES